MSLLRVLGRLTYMARNVLGGELESCSTDPVTGFTRTGQCDLHPQDGGFHIICCLMTNDFLKFSKEAGNDLSTPRPEYGFAGLKAGDRWCVCASRWAEALVAIAGYEETMDVHERKKAAALRKLA